MDEVDKIVAGLGKVVLPAEQIDRDLAAQFVKAVGGEGFRAGHHHRYARGDADEAMLVQVIVRSRLIALRTRLQEQQK